MYYFISLGSWGGCNIVLEALCFLFIIFKDLVGCNFGKTIKSVDLACQYVEQ